MPKKRKYCYRQEWIRGPGDTDRLNGPYWYAYYREGGRQRKTYVGVVFRRLPDDPLPQSSTVDVHPFRPSGAREWRPSRVRSSKPRDTARAALFLDDATETMRVARGLRASAVGLIFVPTLVKAMIGRDRSAKTVERAHTALLKAAHAGLLELRPESGLARLTADELALCVPGPQKTQLSWARVL